MPSLLFGSELFTLTPSLLLKLGRYQLWFLKNIFYVPSFAHSTLILKLSGLNSVESEIDVNRLLSFGRLITEPKMATVVKNLFRSRAESYFYSNISSTGVLPNICEALRKYDLFDYFKLWFEISVFPVYSWWKATVRRKVCENQNEVWSDFCLKHPDLKQAYDRLNNVPPYHFWSLADHYPDLVSWLHVQVRIMGNLGANGGILRITNPWFTNTEDAICFVCKQGVETVNHFLLECPLFKENLDSLWDKLKTKARHLNPVDGDQIVDFITSLHQHNKMLLLLGGLLLPFDDLTANSIKIFVAAAVGTIFKIRTEKLRELGAPWLTDKPVHVNASLITGLFCTYPF